MKKLNIYKYENNGVTATIENKGQYWLLTITHPTRLIIIDKSSQIWNTKRGAKNYALTVLAQY